MNISFGGTRKGKGQKTTISTASPAVVDSPTTGSLDDILSLATASRPAETPSPPDDNWETVDISSSDYARKRRELMQLVTDLRSLGGENFLDLPSIVVIGGQSAGKSSLVEAVSGVNVPRDSGTCTRCPMECNMSSNATTWSCTIKLRFDYDSVGRPIVQGREIHFGPVITEKDDMDIWLRRAQTAILNPDLPPEIFHKKSREELKNFASTRSLKFSRNVVSIFLEDPSATDLSFVDLPGLIQNEDEDVLDLVRELTEHYIRRPNTFILTTIPMSDDIQNQLSVRLARDADPEGERTIGILTKPDTLGDGAVNSKKFWVDVIEGRQHQLKHGYYCVRLPDDAQRAQRLPRSALQRIASEYFDKTSPWSDVSDRGRFGVPAFVSDISVLLVKHIYRVIPQLKRDVERLLTFCLEDIGALPKPIEEDPPIVVLEKVTAFCDAFRGIVSGTSSDKTLAQRNIAHYTIFARTIRGTSPDFRPFDDPKQYTLIDALESEEPSTTRHMNVKIMGLYDVRKTILESIAWELPGNIPYEAKARLIGQFTSLWSAPADVCLTSINTVLDEVVEQLVETHFGRFKVLRNLITDLIRPDIEEHKEKAHTAVEELLELEMIQNYTENRKDFRDFREKWLGKYRHARKFPEEHKDPKGNAKSRQNNPGVNHNSATQQALQYLAQAGYQGLTAEDLARLLPQDDQFDDEMIVMADVRAYFTIAYKRIIDHLPLRIERTLHQALAKRLSHNLLQCLIVDTNSAGNFADRMKELVSEDPATEERRHMLEAKRTRLQGMKRKLLNLTA